MKSYSATRGGPVFLVIKLWFTIRCIKLRLLSSYLQCWKAKCVLTFNQEMAVIYMFCAYNKKFFLSICQRNWNNLWVFITYFISPKTPAKCQAQWNIFNILLTSSNNQISGTQNPQYFVYLLDQTVGRDTLQFIYWNHTTFSNSF